MAFMVEKMPLTAGLKPMARQAMRTGAEDKIAPIEHGHTDSGVHFGTLGQIGPGHIERSTLLGR